MKVRQLIKQLKKCNPDDMVVISRDSEGNGFSELYELNTDDYNFHEAEIGLRNLSPDDRENGYTDDDIMSEGVPCVVLWP